MTAGKTEVCSACGGRVTATIGRDLAAALDVHIASCPAAIRRIDARKHGR